MIPVITPIIASSSRNKKKKKCPVCSHELETEAHNCPTCGYLLETVRCSEPSARVAVFIGVLLLVFGCLAFFLLL